MDDLISRRSASNALEKCCKYCCREDEVGDRWIHYETTLNEIESIPSAQPDIIRCKDCKHHWTYKSMDRMPIERCDLEQTFYDAEVDYCSLAERRGEQDG